jgi:Arc/MetJ family transcription regulator
MRTTLNVDQDALEAAMKLAPGLTKTEIINEALREFARRKRRKELLAFRGMVVWEGEVDELRQRQ